ncbi:hypothetical protein HMPREF0972_02431 [Actinomyces sp. oral taxon 848 str. F0332]|nr:hypothetical protein HMPREF0972_02431 [Actinomyces sp. oral taxon 848 str. F0332]
MAGISLSYLKSGAWNVRGRRRKHSMPDVENAALAPRTLAISI